MKRHCKTGLPQPNVIWHTVFSEPAIPRPRQEWWNIYETCMSQVFPFVPSSALLVFALMLNGCLAQLGPPIRCPQEGNVLLAFSTLYCSQLCWAGHSWKLGSLLQVTDPFALRSSCRDSHGPRQGTQGTLHQVLQEIRKRRYQYYGGTAQSLNKSSPSSSFLTAQSLTAPFPSQPVRHWGCSILVGAPHRKKKQWKSSGYVCAEPNCPAREHFIITTHGLVLLLS